MKVFVALSALLAAAVAAPAPGYLGAAHGVLAAAPALVAVHGVHPGYAAYGPAHIAVGPGGYVLDTPEVAASRAAHLSAVAQTQARDAHINSAYAHAALAAPAAVLAAAHAPGLLGAHGLGYAHGHLPIHG
ncbi:cuticle protein 18.7-like isoform X2 [Schistocerca nitens]|uniref:cuticle protein 18.7-like isoform X2 n=1 Tax=Schistocerca nitens TaxID=7011 RepID=UPI002117E186|nr:cuticle protein 18.7-like isoform X2 [Schistocerca nitens]